jgi:flavin prenyltransferase
MSQTQPIILGITGATGTPLGFALLKELLLAEQTIELIFTDKCQQVLWEETGFRWETGTQQGNATSRTVQLVKYLGLPEEASERLSLYGNQEIGQKPASGTYLTKAMVICPCSMGTLAKIAHGLADNLVCRAADVTLKESRKLILVPRETPLNALHLENMLKLSRLGVRMIPPMLSFYSKEFLSMEGQMAYTVGKILDHLDLHHTLYQRWQGLGHNKSL